MFEMFIQQQAAEEDRSTIFTTYRKCSNEIYFYNQGDKEKERQLKEKFDSYVLCCQKE